MRRLVLVRFIHFLYASWANRSEREDMHEGCIGSMKELGVTESYKLKRQVVLSASEAAEMIIRFVAIYHI